MSNTRGELLSKLETASEAYVVPGLSLEHQALEEIRRLVKILSRCRTHFMACVSETARNESDWAQKLLDIMEEGLDRTMPTDSA